MNESWIDPVKSEELAALRHEIHRWPEPGWAEFASTARAVERLEREGFKVRCGAEFVKPESVMGAIPREVEAALADAKRLGVSEALLARMGGLTGVVAEFDTGRAGPTVAIRCELDCVCVDETKDPAHRPNAGGWASERPGYMHACGHDGHQAVMLNLARWVRANAERLSGRIKLIMEPGEEGSRGGRPFAESGVVDDVDFFYALHVGCDVPAGTVIVAPEKFLCTTKADLFFKGSPSHAGMQPEVGRNALLAASTAALALMALPRHGSGMTRVNVGWMQAGEGRNVVPASAEMRIEVRGETEAINALMYREAVRRAEGAAAMYGCTAECLVKGEALDFKADPEAVEAAEAAAKDAPYVERVEHYMNFNGSDDATVLVKRVQARGGRATYIVVGSTLEAGHHQAAFDFEEKHLETLYAIEKALLRRHCARN